MTPPSTLSTESSIASALHIEFIQNAADRQSDEGLKDVESYHQALFLQKHGLEMTRHQQSSRTLGERLCHLEERLSRLRSQLTQREKLISTNEQREPNVLPNPSWNAWDLAMFMAALLGVVSLLAFGVLNISFNLLESGILTFAEHPVRAYFWAALLPAGALAVKVGWDLLSNSKAQAVYLWSCLAIGLLAALAWIAAYAVIYPTLSQSPEEQIAALSVFDNASGQNVFAFGSAKTVDMLIVASQALAEIFLSALLGIYMTILCLRHRQVRLVADPEFARMDRERIQIEEQVLRARVALAEANGNEQRLQSQLAALIALAKSTYEREVALRADITHRKRILLGRITDQFRRQLDSLDQESETQNGPLEGNTRIPTGRLESAIACKGL